MPRTVTGTDGRQSLVTAVAIRRPLSWGFASLLALVLVVALLSAGLAWHAEQKHRQLRQTVRDLGARVAAAEQAQQSALSAQREGLRAVLEQKQALDELMGNDVLLRQRWLTARAQEAVTLAEQYLRIRGDLRAAITLLAEAEALLSAHDDLVLQPLQRALRQDLSLLQALPAVDLPAVFEQLQQLRDGLASLDLPAPAMPAPAVAAGNAGTGWPLFRQRLQEAVAQLVVIRRLDQPLPHLLDSERRALQQDQWQLQLSAIELALLRQDELLFRRLLEALQQQVLQALPGPALPTALRRQLDDLQSVTIAPTLPRLNSRAALTLLQTRASEGS